MTPPVAPPRRWPPADVSGRRLPPDWFGPAAACPRFRPVRLPVSSQPARRTDHRLASLTAACLTTAYLTTAYLTTAYLTTAYLTTGRTRAALAQVLDPVVVLVLVLASRVIPGRQPIVAVGPTSAHATRFP